MSGTLYGVGVGPGAADLLAVRAVEVLRRAAVIAAPRPDPASPSLALRIAREAAGEVPGQEELLVTFPMTRDPEVRLAARRVAVRAVADRLASGRDVAFVTEGDPLLYSTFLDLLEAQELGGARVEIVPGISSINAVAAAARVPLADGEDRVAVLPAERALAGLPRLASDFETLVLVKAGRHLREIRDALAAVCPAACAWAVIEASRPGERVMPLDHLDGLAGPAPGYFTTVLVRTGKPPHSAREA